MDLLQKIREAFANLQSLTAEQLTGLRADVLKCGKEFDAGDALENAKVLSELADIGEAVTGRLSAIKQEQEQAEQQTQAARDRLTAEDLLPKDAANSKWAQMNPAGQGDVQGVNFLSAAWQAGVDTQGSSLRNSSWDLRSEPPNPQVAVSPWQNSTIEPNLLRRPLEIGGDF